MHFVFLHTGEKIYLKPTNKSNSSSDPFSSALPSSKPLQLASYHKLAVQETWFNTVTKHLSLWGWNPPDMASPDNMDTWWEHDFRPENRLHATIPPFPASAIIPGHLCTSSSQGGTASCLLSEETVEKRKVAETKIIQKKKILSKNTQMTIYSQRLFWWERKDLIWIPYAHCLCWLLLHGGRLCEIQKWRRQWKLEGSKSPSSSPHSHPIPTAYKLGYGSALSQLH